MRSRLVCWLFVTVLLGSSVGLQAQNRPDFSGIWTRTGRKPNEYFFKGQPPLQPWAKAMFDENRTGLKADEDGLDAMDPTIYCMPHGIPRVLASSQPFEIVQSAKVLYELFESQQMQRRIFLDGTKMPDLYPPSYMGWSTGRFDGDTLVVETAGLNDSTWIDTSGAPHSDQLKVTERMRRTGPDSFEVQFRLEDQKAFTRVIEDTKTYQLRSDWNIMENIGYCDDRFRYDFSRRIFKDNVGWQSVEQAAESK